MLLQQKLLRKTKMKKFGQLFEQHREEGRFKPTIPHTVKGVGPRPQVDSASVKLKEEDDTMEKKEMAETQLHFIKYAAEEILEYIEMGGEIEEWYQNKLSKAQSEFESLHSYIEGESRRLGMKEDVQQEVSEAYPGHVQRGKELDAATKKIQSNLDKRIKKVDKNDVPFDPPYKKASGTVTDKSGAKHGPMSTVRHLARQSLKRQAAKVKPVKESLEESRKAEIVKEIAKKKKTETTPKGKDKFESDPVLSNEIMKS